MRKLHIALILALTAGLIALGAFLPGIAGAAADLIATASVRSAPMESVELEFSNGQDDPARMLRKLALEQHMNTLPVTAQETSMTEEAVFAAVESCMEAYVSEELFYWFKDTYRMAEPYLAISRDDTSNVSIFWAVHIVHEGDPYRNLFLHVDDETGKILYLDYVTYDPDSTFYPEDQSRVVDTLAQIYFDQLGLTEPAASDSVTVDELVDNDVHCLRYTFPDTDYGSIVIEFYSKPNGFYILFPK